MNEEKNSINTFANLSRVTPDKRKIQVIKNIQMIFLVGICCAIFFFMFAPQKTKAEIKTENKNHDAYNLTLSQNLEYIEKIKAQERRKLVEEGRQAVIPKHRSAPLLKTNQENSINDTQKLNISREIRLRMNAQTTFEIAQGKIGSDSDFRDEKLSVKDAKRDDATLIDVGDSNTRFINSMNEISAVNARKLPHPTLTIVAGEIIPATLETAINSDLPGMTRAITTRDIYSLQGRNVLIPRGSILVGQFNSSILESQNRIMIVWNRVQMSDGVVVTLNSPATDALGNSGQRANYVDNHFLKRFGTSVLLSILGAYSATSGVGTNDQYNSLSQYRNAIASSFQKTSEQTLDKTSSIKPTLQIKQGTKINVFVAHDLDFAEVGKVLQRK